MRCPNRHSDSIADLVHEKSVEILKDVGFCVPEPETLSRLESAGFPTDHESQMVRVKQELIDAAFSTLNQDVKLYDRAGESAVPFNHKSCFMGASTPVHVFDLDSGNHQPATQTDVRQLVRLQDALPEADIVRPTVTATDRSECSDLIEIAELLRNSSKPIVHRTLSADRVDAAVEMLTVAAGGDEALRDKPSFATLYCPISPSYFTPENIKCMLRWAKYGVPVTILSMAMGGASTQVTLLELAGQGKFN
jgi:trimethylamine--corrinoid protein Co-methyltransferase